MWGMVLKKGAIFDCLPTILGVLDAEFNVDYDFATKHDLILWSEWLMGVQSCKNSDNWGQGDGSEESVTECSIEVPKPNIDS